MRARLQPEQVGLSSTGRRPTPGLRRQEVAQLAAVSVDWYIRLEQGRVGTPGSAVLDALAQALVLSETERHHLYLIARGEAPTPRHLPIPVSDSLLDPNRPGDRRQPPRESGTASGRPRLRVLIAELRHGSADFATWWDDQTVHTQTHGTKRIRHPVGGVLTVCYDVLALQDGSDQYLATITPADARTERVLRTIVTRYAEGTVDGPGLRVVGS
jgi:transcriptional regulator with XRE-family HTH domain